MSSDSTEATKDHTASTDPNSGAPAAQSQDPPGQVLDDESVIDSPESESTVTQSDNTGVDDDHTKGPKRQPILIGSQRDPANPKLTPNKPKAVREAKNPPADPSPVQQLEDTVRPTSQAVTSDEQQESPPLPDESEPESSADADPLLDMPLVSVPPITDDLEREIEEALGDVSLDQLVAQQDESQAGDELPEDSRHKATVVKIHRDDVFFTLGGRHQGVTSVRQFKKPPKAGAMMDVIVRRYNAEDGLYELGIPGASVDVADWSDLADGTVVEARITGSNTGGLECMVNNIRGFIPTSQIALYHVDNMAEFINQKLQCVVMEVNPRRRKLVLSHRAIMERQREQQRKNLLEQLEVGQVCEGTVRSLRDFGAFVDLGGVDGLIHISKLSWDHVTDPHEVLKEGDPVKVKIEKVNKQTGKISLSYRDLQDHPWEKVEQNYAAGGVVSGTISRIAKFGAFVKLQPGVEGMIHISELAHQRVSTVSQVVSEGQEVEVKVLSVDRQAQRIALSLKATQAEPQPGKLDAANEADRQLIRPLAVPSRKKPLKGGTDRKSGGEQFGLKW